MTITALPPDFASRMTVEDAVEILGLTEPTVDRLLWIGIDSNLASIWSRITDAQRREITIAYAREEAHAARAFAELEALGLTSNAREYIRLPR